jgi:hypothetical protein
LLKQKRVFMFQTTMRGTDTQQSSMFSYLSPEERVPEAPVAADPADGRRCLEVAVASVQPTLFGLWPAFDSAGEVIASLAFTGAVYDSQRNGC